MKKYYLLSFFLLFTPCLFSQSFEWVKQAGGNNGESGKAIATDSEGNVYVAGSYFSESVSFDSFELNTGWYSNFFLVKYNKRGDLLWVRNASGDAGIDVRGMCLDKEGNCYITGGMGGSITLRGGGSTITLLSKGHGDFFAAKYGTDGNILWGTTYGYSDNNEYSETIALDDLGFVYLGGSYSNRNENGAALVKLNPINGETVWERRVIGSASINSIKIQEEYLYVAGDILFSNRVETGNIGSIVLEGNSNDILLGKYDLNGNLVWIKNIGGDGYERANSLVIDSNENIYITGAFINKSDFCGVNLESKNYRAFIAKFLKDGEFVWVGSVAEGIEASEGFSITVGKEGNIYLGGFFCGKTDFGAGTSVVTLESPSNKGNSFITKYDDNGKLLWAKQILGQSNSINDISVDDNGSCFITGSFSVKAKFDNLSVDAVIANCCYDNDIYIAKLNEDTPSEINGKTLNKGSFNVFPNPSTQKIILNYYSSEINNITIKVISSIGQTVYSSEGINVQGDLRQIIDLNKEAPGIYFIEVINGADRQVKKVVLSK
jgi:hypothetical protein